MSVVAMPVPPAATAVPARPDAALVRALRARDEQAYPVSYTHLTLPTNSRV